MIDFKRNEFARVDILPRGIGRHERDAKTRRCNRLRRSEHIAPVSWRQAEPLRANDRVDVLLNAETRRHENQAGVGQLLEADTLKSRQRMTRAHERAERRGAKRARAYRRVPRPARA